MVITSVWGHDLLCIILCVCLVWTKKRMIYSPIKYPPYHAYLQITDWSFCFLSPIWRYSPPPGGASKHTISTLILDIWFMNSFMGVYLYSHHLGLEISIPNTSEEIFIYSLSHYCLDSWHYSDFCVFHFLNFTKVELCDMSSFR